MAWLLSFISILYTRLTPTDVFSWGSTALPWHIEYIFQAMFYMVLGYMFRHNFEGLLDSRNTLMTRIASFVLYILIVFVPFFAKIEMPIIIDIPACIINRWFPFMVGRKREKTIRNKKYENTITQ